jgi:COP9 signalosome complex subunit 5
VVYLKLNDDILLITQPEPHYPKWSKHGRSGVSIKARAKHCYTKPSNKLSESDNDIKLVDPTRDALYAFDSASQNALSNAKPWRSDHDHFKSVRISAVALLKMVMHARSGGSIEVMGLMLGSIHGDTFVVTDSFRLPVEGTETRVNAQEEANEYMVTYLEKLRESGRPEVPVGWYHSHPGYGCWLSGIDVQTQHLQQQFSDPFLAVVVDPDRTMSAGKVEIGAFRTYPEDHKARGSTTSDGWQVIPMEKVKDFGAYADRYYSLDVSYFKSTLDTHLLSSLWNKYWVSTLSSNPLLATRDYGTKQIKDLASKMEEASKSQGDSGKSQGPIPRNRNFEVDDNVDKIVKASQKIEVQQRTGLMASTVKTSIFSVDSAAGR